MEVFKTTYRGIIRVCDKYVPKKLRPLWEHPAGPKTVFFWAPVFKWGLVIAGIADLNRPPEKLSTRQCATLATSGFIWARYSLVIVPVNYALFSVNIFLGVVQLRQLIRVILYEQQQKAKQKKDDEV